MEDFSNYIKNIFSSTFKITKLDERKHDEMHKLLMTGKSIKELNLVEVYFMTEFLKKVENNFDINNNQMKQIFAKYFCIIDKDMIDLFFK